MGKPNYPKNCDPNSNPFDLLNYLEWRADSYPRRPVETKAPAPKVTHLRERPFADLASLVTV